MNGKASKAMVTKATEMVCIKGLLPQRLSKTRAKMRKGASISPYLTLVRAGFGDSDTVTVELSLDSRMHDEYFLKLKLKLPIAETKTK